MSLSTELTQRMANLVAVLESHELRTRSRARWNHRTSVTLMVLSVVCSTAAAVLGLATTQYSKWVGGLAGLSPIIALIAMNMKLEGKASWHHRKANSLCGLKSRLQYELPEQPTADQIAAISKAYDALNRSMQEEWDKTLTFNWSAVRAASQSNESSGVPAPVPPNPGVK